jgi:hypothetical protein
LTNEKANFVPNITGFIDLLGFDSNLNLGEQDLRTAAGKLAFSRLKNLKNAISKLNNEKKNFPDFYPTKNFSIRQINDAIVISGDLDRTFLPRIGKRFEGYPRFNYEDFKKLHRISPNGKPEIAYPPAIKKDPGLIVGAIARVHKFINDKENTQFLPGCRTIITSGIRSPSHDDGDMLSTNLAFSLAWKANEKGSDTDLSGPNIYVEKSVASILASVDEISKNILRMSKFEVTSILPDPYVGTKPHSETIQVRTNKIIENNPIEVKIGVERSPLIFRKSNPTPLSALQILSKLDISKLKRKERAFFSAYLKELKCCDEDVLNYNVFLRGPFKFKLPLWLDFGLDDDYLNYFKNNFKTNNRAKSVL